MTNRSDPRLVQRFNGFAAAASWFSMAVGLSALAGWAFHIAGLTTWGARPRAMVANTAACFVLAGISLWFQRKPDLQSLSVKKLIARTAAALVGLVGLLSLVESTLGWDFGIDQLLAAVPPAEQIAGLHPGLMSPLTAFDFLVLALALLLLDWKTRREDWPAQFLCCAALIGTALGLGNLVLEPHVSSAKMALPTAVTFLVLTCGLVCSRAPWAIGGLLSSASPGARLLRRVVPAAVLVLSLIGWLISGALLTEIHFTWVEVSALAILSSVMLAGFITWIAFIIDRSDAERKKIEDASQISKEQLDRLLGRIEEPPAEARLRRLVKVGFAVAVLLSGFLGLLSWRNGQEAAEGADWVVHTQAVLKTLEATLRHLVDVETGARGFGLSGHEPFLEPYEAGRRALITDLEALRHLTAENSVQQQRLDVLEPQLRARMEASEKLVAARRQTDAIPTERQLEQDKQLMDAARATIQRMEDEEERLLELRTRKASAARRWTRAVTTLASVLGMAFLAIAGFSLSREVGVSARARAQVNALNADLERRVAQRTAALGESEGRLAGVIQSAMDSIITVDEQQRIVLFNAAAERMFRCPAAEALGQPLERFLPQRFRGAHSAHIRKFGETGATNRAMGALSALWALRADGEEFQIEASISQVGTAGKKMFTVILRDVTERVRGEASRLRLAAIVESTDSAVLGKDLSGIITSWNQGAERLYGYREEEMLGKHINLVIPPELQAEEQDLLRQVAQGKVVQRDEAVRRRKDGTLIFISLIVSPIRNTSAKIVGVSTIAHDITERKQAEEALRQSNARRSFALETARLGDWELDLTTLQATRSLLHDQIFGYESLLPEWNLDIFLRHVYPDDRERVRENFQSCASQGKRWEFECRIVCRNGDLRWIWACGDHYPGPAGDATRMFGIVKDITERKRVEDEVRQSEERLHLALDCAKAGTWEWDLQTNKNVWSRQLWALYGMELNSREPSYELWLSTIHPEDREITARTVQQAATAGNELDVEYRAQESNGRTRWFMARGQPMRDAAGQPIRFVGIILDITDRKLAAEQLAQQAEELSCQAEDLQRSQQALEIQTLMLQSVLDSMAEGLVAADEQGNFILWNPAARRILGREAAGLPSQEWAEHYGVYLPDGVTPFPPEQVPLARAIRGEACTAEMYIRNPERTAGVWIEASAGPLKDQNGAVRGGVVALRDITQKRAGEMEIRKLNDELEERVRQRTAELETANKELEAFTYSVSHDLRAPLRHISGFSKILLEEFAAQLEPGAQHYLRRIQEGTRRMGLLVDDLLNLARVGRREVQRQVTGLDSIVKDAVEDLKLETEGRSVEWKIGSLPYVEGDPALLRQVFQNLLSNALKYSRPRAHALIEVGQKQVDGQAAVFVRDNGVGFSMKYADKLFGVFQRLHRPEDFEGTGIGLATVQRIVHKHGGRIWAEAELDRGATFYFTLGQNRLADVEAATEMAGERS